MPLRRQMSPIRVAAFMSMLHRIAGGDGAWIYYLEFQAIWKATLQEPGRTGISA